MKLIIWRIVEKSDEIPLLGMKCQELFYVHVSVVSVHAIVVVSIVIGGNELYLFSPFGNKIKRGIGFRHSTHIV